MSKTIAIDFDGVIHKYSKGWQDGEIYDEPIPGAFEAINSLFAQGYSVFIFSSRSPRQIKKWLDKYLWYYDPLDYHCDHNDRVYPYHFKAEVIPFWTKFWDKYRVAGITRKKLPAIAYIDDRAVPFKNDWLEILDIFLRPKQEPES